MRTLKKSAKITLALITLVLAITTVTMLCLGFAGSANSVTASGGSAQVADNAAMDTRPPGEVDIGEEFKYKFSPEDEINTLSVHIKLIDRKLLLKDKVEVMVAGLNACQAINVVVTGTYVDKFSGQTYSVDCVYENGRYNFTACNAFAKEITVTIKATMKSPSSEILGDIEASETLQF